MLRLICLYLYRPFNRWNAYSSWLRRCTFRFSAASSAAVGPFAMRTVAFIPSVFNAVALSACFLYPAILANLFSSVFRALRCIILHFWLWRCIFFGCFIVVCYILLEWFFIDTFCLGMSWQDLSHIKLWRCKCVVCTFFDIESMGNVFVAIILSWTVMSVTAYVMQSIETVFDIPSSAMISVLSDI